VASTGIWLETAGAVAPVSIGAVPVLRVGRPDGAQPFAQVAKDKVQATTVRRHLCDAWMCIDWIDATTSAWSGMIMVRQQPGIVDQHRPCHIGTIRSKKRRLREPARAPDRHPDRQ